MKKKRKDRFGLDSYQPILLEVDPEVSCCVEDFIAQFEEDLISARTRAFMEEFITYLKNKKMIKIY